MLIRSARWLGAGRLAVGRGGKGAGLKIRGRGVNRGVARSCVRSRRPAIVPRATSIAFSDISRKPEICPVANTFAIKRIAEATVPACAVLASIAAAFTESSPAMTRACSGLYLAARISSFFWVSYETPFALARSY